MFCQSWHTSVCVYRQEQELTTAHEDPHQATITWPSFYVRNTPEQILRAIGTHVSVYTGMQEQDLTTAHQAEVNTSVTQIIEAQESRSHKKKS